MSTNISKKKRDDLLDKIKQIRAFIAAAPQDENTGNLLSYLSELEKDVNGKKYGLVFEEHREEIDEVLDTHTPVLTEDADLFIDHGVQMNFLIEGDNLASLQLLEKTHKGKIDLIYIDPPYNTGAKDFVYDDAFVDTTDGFNHSKWLSFMKQRLSLSKKLLAAHGTIFISIDDNEFSQLKLLCDEVFGANNYVGTILWKKKTNGNNMGWLPPVHDYILCYSKEIGKIYDFGFEVSEEDLSWLKNFDAESLARSYEQRAQITIADMRRKIENCDTGKLTKDAGEYVVSELAREAIVSELNYLDIPLAELLGKKISGNPGFDFHSQNNATNTVIFGEAKYVTAHSGYPRAIDQIKAFVDDKKDIADIADLRDFCSADALSRVVDGFKGFAAAFSAKSTPSDRLISAITAKDSFQELLKYEEVILVAVNL